MPPKSTRAKAAVKHEVVEFGMSSPRWPRRPKLANRRAIDDSSDEDVKPSARTSSKRGRDVSSSEAEKPPTKKRAAVVASSSKQKPRAKVEDDEDFKVSEIRVANAGGSLIPIANFVNRWRGFRRQTRSLV